MNWNWTKVETNGGELPANTAPLTLHTSFMPVPPTFTSQ